MSPNLTATAHRPWPLPERHWVMAQSWRDVLFAHWPVPVEPLRRILPAGLELDMFDGQAWLGIVPLRMTNVHARGLPAIPGTSEFPELNVRTYVSRDGKPGVYFFSLDASSRLAVEAARVTFGLNYLLATMSCERRGDEVVYSSKRTDERAAPATFAARYRGTGYTYAALPGTLEHFLCERYCLYAGPRADRMWRGDIHHAPWPLQRCEAVIVDNTMAEPLGLALEGPPHLLFSEGEDVAIWLPLPC